MEKILNQVFCCLVIAFALIIAGESGNEGAENLRAEVLQQLNRDYTAAEVKAAISNGVEAVRTIPAMVNSAVAQVNAPIKYGEPIDAEPAGSGPVPVYSVGGGTVVETGNSGELGNFVVISHGNEAKSVYGNLESVSVRKPERVKKGQIIGSYDRNGEKEFYYSFEYI